MRPPSIMRTGSILGTCLLLFDLLLAKAAVIKESPPNQTLPAQLPDQFKLKNYKSNEIGFKLTLIFENIFWNKNPQKGERSS